MLGAESYEHRLNTASNLTRKITHMLAVHVNTDGMRVVRVTWLRHEHRRQWPPQRNILPDGQDGFLVESLSRDGYLRVAWQPHEPIINGFHGWRQAALCPHPASLP
jgi:hypothetical protein